MTHPYSIFIWKPPLSHTGKGSWIEAYQAWNEDYAFYAANLIYRDSKAVIKVVRYGLNLACFPDEKAVQLVERQIARQFLKDMVTVVGLKGNLNGNKNCIHGE